MELTIERARTYARSGVVVHTDTLESDLRFIEKLAQKMVEQDKNGLNPSVWHCVSLLTGKTCYCAECRKARGEKPFCI